MPDRGDRRETMRAGSPLRVGDATLVPIERVVLRSRQAARGAWVAAALEPCALVVRSEGRVRVLSIDGDAIPLERLRERIPGLDALLA